MYHIHRCIKSRKTYWTTKTLIIKLQKHAIPTTFISKNTWKLLSKISKCLPKSIPKHEKRTIIPICYIQKTTKSTPNTGTTLPQKLTKKLPCFAETPTRCLYYSASPSHWKVYEKHFTVHLNKFQIIHLQPPSAMCRSATTCLIVYCLHSEGKISAQSSGKSFQKNLEQPSTQSSSSLCRLSVRFSPPFGHHNYVSSNEPTTTMMMIESSQSIQI